MRNGDISPPRRRTERLEETYTTYGAGRHVRTSNGIAGAIFSLLILLGACLNACQDQPLDNTGVTVIRDTIRISRDSVVIRDSIVFNDSVVIRDSIIYRDSILLKDTLIIRDTTVVRDSVRYRDSVVYDTIEVPQNGERHRRATVSFLARPDTASPNEPLQNLTADLTEWLQYTVVRNTSGAVVSVGLSMSATIPSYYGEYSVANMQAAIPFYFRGLVLNVPLFRLGVAGRAGDSIPLNRHPFDWLPSQDRSGGMMITAQVGESPLFFQGWTGQAIDPRGASGGKQYVSEGHLRIIGIDRNIVYVQIQGTVFIAAEINGGQVIDQYPIFLDLELGY